MIDRDGDDAVVRVHVQPRAGRDAVAGVHGDALRVRVHAPPIDGRATEAARAVVAAAFGIARSRVELVGGERSRLKRFRLAGVAPEVAARRVAALTAGREG